jgi:putative NIF3 family GTP cyclohydrolase 1 type 2
MKNTDFAIKVSDDLGYGIRGEISDLSLKELAEKIKNINKAKYVQVYKNNDKNTKIMILNGSGKDFLDNVLESMPDTLVTSDLGYHDVQALRNAKINLIMQDHNSSESAFVNIMEDILKKNFKDIEIIKNFSSFTDNIEIL